jgi:diguanylate cyclase (GGDEF)-like protein
MAVLSVVLLTVAAAAVAGVVVRRALARASDAEQSAREAADRQRALVRLSERALVERLGTGPLMQAATDALVSALGVDHAEVREHVAPGKLRQVAESGSPPPRDGTSGGMSIRIGGDDEPFGVIEVRTAASGRLPDEDARFVESVANVLAGAVERDRAERELTAHAMHDPLTGAASRIAFEDRLRAALARAKRSKNSLVGVLCVDLDTVDSERAGDELLRQVPTRLAAAVPGATVARLGGDQFGLLVEDLGRAQSAYEAAIRIQGRLRPPFDLASGRLRTTASIGIAVAGANGRTGEAVISEAESAMRRARNRGAGAIELFDGRLARELAARLRAEDEIRHALVHSELRLLYQPIVSLPDGAVVGAEALVRWLHPRHGLLEPHEFIPIAEQSALIADVGNWVLREACCQLARWEEGLQGRPLRLAVNVSARQLAGPGFIGHLEAVLGETGADPERLVVELSEAALEENAPLVSDRIAALHRVGVHVFIDAFGAGDVSTQRVRATRVDGIKLDRSLVGGIGADASSSALVTAAVGMGLALDVEVVAMGIETAEQEGMLAELGCPSGQGFRYARPMPAPLLSELYVQRAAA